MNKKIWHWVISIVIVIVVIVGGKLYMDHKAEQDYMVNVVKSDEAKKIFEKELRYIDPQALKQDGIIKNYKIDMGSVKHNPMGGIDVTLILNKSSDITLQLNLNKDSGKLASGVVIESQKLVSLDDKIHKNKVEANQ